MENEPFWVGSVLAPGAEMPTASGGGGSADNSSGMMILLVVFAMAAIGGVYALSMRSREDEKKEGADG